MPGDCDVPEVPSPSLPGLRMVRALVIGLELLIGLYAAALALIVLTGGGQLGPLSLREPAKPVLVLLLLLPIRLSLPHTNGLLSRVGGGCHRAWQRIGRSLGPVGPAVTDVAVVLILTRGATIAIAFMANLLLPASRLRSFELPFERSKFVEIFVAWDSGWYFDIARRGYYFTPDGQSSVAFFPLYPLVVRLVAWPWGGSEPALWIAGIVVSCGAFATAMVVLHRLSEEVFGSREAARRTVLYLALFPFSLFMTRVYAESLLLLASVAAVRSAWHGHWGTAGLWGSLATLARPNGILIALPLALLALHGAPGWRDVARRSVALLPVPLALVGFCLYIHVLTGHPLTWLSSQHQWGYSLGHAPWEQLLKLIERFLKYGPYDYFFVSNLAPYRLMHGVSALLFLGLTPAVFRRLGPALGSFVLVSLLVPLSGNALEGVGRYSAGLFPVFMVLGGGHQSRHLHEALFIGMAAGLTFLVTLFVTLHPIY